MCTNALIYAYYWVNVHIMKLLDLVTLVCMHVQSIQINIKNEPL